MHAKIDRRFSDPSADPTPWATTEGALTQAELYWITTVREDGRPHVTPLIGAYHDGALHFTTGLREQKYRNLERSPKLAMTTGNNTWAQGLDVVVEGTAARVSDNAELQRLADAIVAKYGEVWRFTVGDGVFDDAEGGPAAAFRVEATKVIAFAKDPHGQTTYAF
ncbi:pyridoxamine 5'-phosphate oxidase family protein [Solirubrobacter phytolaccae]|uniref:Pyridoxamine 5'-phosphate oxidase family protein n=1 Tax=Solirubrobacter phytolaccae TaxID=1404360 RepID=A0A9X3S959_9ACTN|nr:pyridoxamine 5'-phosphate oxidase family protein [Solirubrobacter phytolaccae]MDA0183034.1 pyridoxamine 5'-phosphate oxidase family protein [Solirubrobacter phytolaccae]